MNRDFEDMVLDAVVSDALVVARKRARILGLLRESIQRNDLEER